MSGIGRARAACVALALALAAPVWAQPAPWAAGVSDADKARAQSHLEAGNARFLEGQYAGALTEYRQALAVWDHPAIRFNIVRVLVNLGKNVEALDNLDVALKYGAAPLEAQVYAEALTLRAALLTSVGEVEVACAERGAAVSIDGQPVLTCPGRAKRRVAPGSHQVVARKPGFLTATRDQLVLGGKRARVDIALVALANAGVTRRRWAVWKPWVVVGGGALVGVMGALLQLKAAGDLDRYDREVADVCGEPGCGPGGNMLPSSTANLESRARLENRSAIALMSIGGAALAGGLVLVWLNRPMSYLPSEDRADRVRLAPAIGPGTASLDLSLTF